MTDARPLLTAALLAPVLLVGCEHGGPAVPAEAADDRGAAAAPPEPVVAGPPVRKTLVLTTTQPARIEAFEQAPLHARVRGYVGEVLVDIGDRVEKGQPLVRIDVPELRDDRRQRQALLAQAEAEVGQAEAALPAAEAARTSAAARAEQAQAGVARAEAEFRRWRAESARLDELAASGSVTQRVADETRNQFGSADAARAEASAAVRSAEAAVAEAAAGVEKAKADVTAAEARRDVADAALKRAETMLAYAEVKAPFPGVVTRRSVDPGHLVPEGGGAEPLVTLARADRVRVFLDVPEIEAARVDVGDPAAVRVQALDGRTVEGAVTRTAWSLDAANRAMRTEIDLDNTDGALRPGMYATATVELERREKVLTLPTTAVARTPDGAFCFVIRGGKAVKTPVTLGLRVGGDWEVASGLTGAESVALAKADTLADGQPVKPAEAVAR